MDGLNTENVFSSHPIQRSRMEQLSVEEGDKLFERSEFLSPPQANAGMREAEGQVAGRFSFAYFSLPPKKSMNLC